MSTVDTLTKLLSELPGVGPRQARRIVFHLLTRNKSWLDRLTSTITLLKAATTQCKHCFRHFEGVSTDVCPLCMSADLSTMMVTEKESDLENVLRLGLFTGRFFVLGGLLPVTSRKHIVSLRAEEFINEVRRSIKEDNLSEIILALPVSTEGDHTADYLAAELSKINNCPTISVLARGLSTGAEIEYSDDKTFQSALMHRSHR